MKKIGGAVYLHRSILDHVSMDQEKLINHCLNILAKSQYSKVISTFDIVKIEKETVSFIECEDWDSASEPIVGDAFKVYLDGRVKVTKKKNNPQIYHHKWMFVADDYDGFDVAAAKKWSEKWEAILPRTREVKSRIGYKDYWEKILNEYGLES